MTDANYDCGSVIDIADEPRHRLIIGNEFVRAFAVEIAPGDRTLCHHHPHDYLFYVASGAEIISAARGEEPKRLHHEDGQCELSPAGLTHVVENLSGTPFRNVVVELLPRSESLRRGAPPTAAAGTAQPDMLLNEVPGAVFRVTMQPGAEVEIAGPAILASAYDDPLTLKEVDAFDIPLDNFCKLMWVCAPRQVAVKNLAKQTARLIVFQIGRQTGERR